MRVTEPTPDAGPTWTNPGPPTWTNPDWGASDPGGDSTWSNPERAVPPSGPTRFAVVSRFGWGRDFVALDPASGAERFIADGLVGLTSAAEIRDEAAAVRYRAEKIPLSFGRVEITDAAGEVVATLSRELSFFTPRAHITVGEERDWNLTGDLMGWQYSIDDGSDELIRVSQEFTLIGEGFTLDVAASVDPALALALLWSLAVLFEPR